MAAIFVSRDRTSVETCKTLMIVVTIDGVPFAKTEKVKIFAPIVPITVTDRERHYKYCKHEYQYLLVVIMNSTTGNSKSLPYSV